MKDMFYSKIPDFEEVMEVIKQLETEINNLK